MSFLAAYGLESGLANARIVRRRDADGYYHAPGGYESFNPAQVPLYCVAAPEIVGTGTYQRTDPTPTTPGDWLLIVPAGATPVPSDLSAGLRWTGRVEAATGGAGGGVTGPVEISDPSIGRIAAALQNAALPHDWLSRTAGDLDLLVPDDYTVASTQPLSFPVEGFPACPADSVVFRVFGPNGFVNVCTTADLGAGKQQVTVADVASSELAALPNVEGVPFRCWCVYGTPNGERTLREGTLWLRRIPR